jgi:predicted RNase H-related nuclease YkuK (DUF458 family)
MNKGNKMSKEKYPEFSEWVWKKFSNLSKKLNLDDFLSTNYERGRAFIVGTDSQIHGKKTTFVTAIVAHAPTGIHSGGEAAISRMYDKTPYPHLRSRLIMEGMRTLEAAYYLDSALPEDALIRIHLDVNNSKEFKSGLYKEELVGWIAGQGYISYRDIGRKDPKDFPRLVYWKPDSWAAMKVADKHT